MKIVGIYAKPEVEYSIAEAVDTALSDSLSGGQIERMEGQLRGQARAIGRLVEFVCDTRNDAYVKELVLSIIGYGFEIKD